MGPVFNDGLFFPTQKHVYLNAVFLIGYNSSLLLFWKFDENHESKTCKGCHFKDTIVNGILYFFLGLFLWILCKFINWKDTVWFSLLYFHWMLYQEFSFVPHSLKNINFISCIFQIHGVLKWFNNILFWKFRFKKVNISKNGILICIFPFIAMLFLFKFAFIFMKVI